MEFQPEIITDNEIFLNKLKCVPYQGNICRSIIGLNYISVTVLEQKAIEKNVIDNIRFLSNACYQFLLPMICLFIYPICDNNQINIRSVCRKSCHYLENDTCTKELIVQQHWHSNCKLRKHFK